MKYRFDKNSLVVIRGNDKKIYSESALYYKLKNLLIKDGYDVIKKLMWKDGHMYGDDTLLYIRSRNMNKPGAFMAYDGNYAIRALYEPYNEDDGEVTLSVEWAEVEPKKKKTTKRKLVKKSRAKKTTMGISGSRR